VSADVDASFQDVRRGPGLAAVFVARNRFAVLDKNRQLHIKNFSNETVKKMAPPNPNTDGTSSCFSPSHLVKPRGSHLTMATGAASSCFQASCLRPCLAV
jgi:hypothetical protein